MNEIWGPDKIVNKILRTQKLVPSCDYKWSQYVLPFSADGRNFLYNTLTRQCLESETNFDPEERFSSERISGDPELYMLQQNYFLAPEEKDETEFYKGIYRMVRAYSTKKGITGYTILTTLGCNARCVYCYEEGRPQVFMSKDTLDRTIAYILETRRKDAKLHFTWFGGEPLMRQDVIDKICSAMDVHKIDFSSFVVTNGSLIDDAIADKMAGKWRVTKAQISMDTSEADYICRRNYRHYDNTYFRVMKNVEKLASRGIRVAIRCNVDFDNIDKMPEFLSDIGKTIENKENIVIYLAQLNECKMDVNTLSLLEKMAGCRELVERAGFSSGVLSRLQRFKANSCMADSQTGCVVITPDGQISTCEHCEADSFYGNIFDGVTRPDVLNSFLEVGEIREKCRSCVYLPECTPFAKCPTQDLYCREVREDIVMHALGKKVRRIGDDAAEQDGQNALC